MLFRSLLVTNDGHLIPDSEIENIFNPFYRLKETENQQGSGIGLSLAHSLTEFHCGRLFYRQTPDGLNQFVLMLPEQQEDSFQTTAGKEKAEIVTLAETGKSVILIVEDQNDMRHFIARELAETYQVLEAENDREYSDRAGRGACPHRRAVEKQIAGDGEPRDERAGGPDLRAAPEFLRGVLADVRRERHGKRYHAAAEEVRAGVSPERRRYGRRHRRGVQREERGLDGLEDAQNAGRH